MSNYWTLCAVFIYLQPLHFISLPFILVKQNIFLLFYLFIYSFVVSCFHIFKKKQYNILLYSPRKNIAGKKYPKSFVWRIKICCNILVSRVRAPAVALHMLVEANGKWPLYSPLLFLSLLRVPHFSPGKRHFWANCSK
jgi:hypothetical protein